MSPLTRLGLALCLVAFAAACAPKEEPPAPEPVSVEPVYTGKYGS